MLVTITIDGNPKEIAALAAELQEQLLLNLPRPFTAESLAKKVNQRLRDQFGQDQVV